jgi:hypothetical protein
LIHYCTYFDHHYLTRGLALYRSLERHSPEFILWALSLDEAATKALHALDLPRLRVTELADLEKFDPQLLDVKGSRSVIEYYFTCTPSWTRFLLQTHPEIDLISYLDADLCFYSDPTPVFEELGDQSVLIIPHRFPPELAHLAIHGTFTVGMVSFRRDQAGMSVLDSWRADCIEWCYDQLVDGKFADQGYLNSWPKRPGVHVLEYLGAGLGPWNAMRFRIDLTREPPTVDGMPLIFYHFQGVKDLGLGLWNLGFEGYGRMQRRLRSWLYGHYIDELRLGAREIQSNGGGSIASGRSMRYAGIPLGQLVRIARQGYVMFKLW